MAEIRIADIYSPLQFAEEFQNLALDKNLLITSGIAVPLPEMDAFLNSAGAQIDLPFWNEFDYEEPNISNDDPSSNPTNSKLTTSKMIGIKQFVNKSWGSMMLSGALSQSDPVAAINAVIMQYFRTDIQRRMIWSLNGIIADNIANDGSDMVINIANQEENTDPTAANLINEASVVDALATLGDRMEDIEAIAVHSVVYAKMVKDGIIDTYIPGPENKSSYRTYLGKILLVDDSLPVVVDGKLSDGTTNRYKYTSYLFGKGSIALATGIPRRMRGIHVEYDPKAGNGAGEEIVYTNVSHIVHPIGFSWIGTTTDYNKAGLETATNWDRVFARKRIKIAALQTNG